MIDTVPRPEASLLEFLAARARHASDERLVAYALGGLVVALAVSYWSGPRWHLFLSAATCFFAFGVWGIADRELGERRHGSRGGVAPLAFLRVVAAILGFGAATFLMLALLGIALGRMIS